MSNAFEYGDALLPRPEVKEGEEPKSPPPMESNQPYLNLATCVALFLLCCDPRLTGHQLPHGRIGGRSP